MSVGAGEQGGANTPSTAAQQQEQLPQHPLPGKNARFAKWIKVITPHRSNWRWKCFFKLGVDASGADVVCNAGDSGTSRMK